MKYVVILFLCSCAFASNGVVVIDGDSIPAGIGLTTPFSSELQPHIPSAFNVSNIAVNGQSCDDATARQAANLYPLYDATAPFNIVIIWCGTNDIANHNVGYNTAYSHLTTYCNNARAHGFKVIVVTMISRTPSGFSNINSGVPGSPAFQIVDNQITMTQVNYNAGGILTLVGSSPAVGQYTFSSTGTVGTTTFNAGDAGQAVQLSGTWNIDVQKNSYNGLILSGWPTIADALVDLTGTALGPDGAYATGFFQPGGIHPTQFSADTIEVPAIAQVLANTIGVPYLNSEAFVQKADGITSPSGTGATTNSFTQTAGNSLIVGVSWFTNSRTPSITDTLGDTFTQVGSTLNVSSGTLFVAVFKSITVLGGSNQVTLALGGTAGFPTINAAEYQNVTAVGTVLTNTGTAGSPPGTANQTVPLAGGIYVYNVQSGGITQTAGTNFLLRDLAGGVAIEDWLNAPVGSQTVALGTNATGVWGTVSVVLVGHTINFTPCWNVLGP